MESPIMLVAVVLVAVLAMIIIVIIKARFDRTQYKVIVEKSALEERLRHKDAALEQERLNNSQSVQEIMQLRSHEQEQQSALRRKRKRANSCLESEIACRLEEIGDLVKRNTSLQTRIAELEARLAAEQRLYKKNGIDPNEAQIQLSRAFRPCQLKRCSRIINLSWTWPGLH